MLKYFIGIKTSLCLPLQDEKTIKTASGLTCCFSYFFNFEMCACQVN